MAEFTLQPPVKKVLEVNIGEETFKIPLAGSLTPKEAAKLDTPAGTIAFVQQYLSDEVAQILTIDEYNAIVRAWMDASRQAGEVVGES